ncbi:histidine-rich glycoprotein-like [Cydia pomonella]|uniref:histidine-rich glycoprotein-like n=1 Tax=Cydia pomonella TaxID=82600 RepID=UPI002ADD5ABB|nr:histidine-rich glycoprotein-like [Cydia pomonella]
MFWKAHGVIVLGLALYAQGHATSEINLKQEFVHHGHHGELAHFGSHSPEHHEEYAWAYPSYEFSYKVNDPHTHDHKGHHEHRHGDEVRGEYWLLQPDGKTRTVKYHSDKNKGFHADVHYSDHHEHREEPRIEKPRVEEPRIEIIKPVIEILDEEPERKIEEIDPAAAVVEKAPEAVVEDREEERPEPTHHQPQKPIHIEYYVDKKMRKHHEEYEKHNEAVPAEPEELHEEEHPIDETTGDSGQEAPTQEDEEPHKPVHIENYSKIHHPIHNEHHGHEKPIHHEEREGEQNRRADHHSHVEQRGRGELRDREEQRDGEEQRSREKQYGHKEYYGHKVHRGHNEVNNWNERNSHEELEHKDLLPMLMRPFRVPHHDFSENHKYSEKNRPVRIEERSDKRYEPHVQLQRMHKPIIVSEYARHPRYHRDHSKKVKRNRITKNAS